MLGLYLAALVLLTIVWLLVLGSSSKPGLRVILGLITIIAYTVGAAGAAVLLTTFQNNADSTGIFKNLTSGLVEITQDDYDPEQLRATLAELDKSSSATYETWLKNEKAVREFLEKYNIEWEQIP